MNVCGVERKNGSLPVYVQVKQQLEEEIHRIYSSGDILPAEKDLAERFGINRHTVRRAIDGLVESGFVERIHGKGTIILDPAINYEINSKTRFTATLERQGRNTKTKVLRKAKIPAKDGVAKRLQLKIGQPVLFIETVRYVDDLPFCIISHFLPFEGHELAYNYNSGSLHAFLKEYCQIELKRIESLISAVIPEFDDAKILKMPKQTPVLRAKSININVKTEQPVEYSVSRFRGDATQLSVNPI